MKRTSLILFSLFFLLSLTSCGRKVILDETRTLQGDTWFRFTPEHYTVSVSNADDCFNFTLELTLDTARYHEMALPIMLNTESPDHTKRTLFATVLLRNREGNWLGHFDEEGRLQVSQNVREYYFFNVAGQHSIDLFQRTNKYEIHGIHNLRFRIEKAKLEYPK